MTHARSTSVTQTLLPWSANSVRDTQQVPHQVVQTLVRGANYQDQEASLPIRIRSRNSTRRRSRFYSETKPTTIELSFSFHLDSVSYHTTTYLFFLKKKKKTLYLSLSLSLPSQQGEKVHSFTVRSPRGL